MAHTRVFEVIPESGTKRLFHWNDADDTFAIETQQDVTPLIEGNKALFNDTPNDNKGDLHRVASLPLNLYFDLKKRGILDDPKKFRAWLNDPENRFFRVKEGRV